METSGNGMVHLASGHPVDEAVDRLKGMLKANGVTVFAVVDHDGEAKKAGLSLRPTKLVIFGNPKAGTPVMQAAPTSAIDLPLKILVWQDDEGKVWVSYNSAEYLQARHGFPEALRGNLAAATGLAAKTAE